jgi:hypothetical protein
MFQLNAATMIAEAERLTGLGDWGGGEFRAPFERLIRSINEESALNALGYERTVSRIQQRLNERLRLFEERKRRPEIAEQKIERPVFVVGLPRAGTTYTHALLGADPGNIAPIGWQLFVPTPPPNDPAIDHSAAIREAQEIVEFQGWNQQHIKALHDYNTLHPEECARIFEMTFHNLALVAYWKIPGYMMALDYDCTPAYELHKKVLQALQVGVQGTKRWVLKSPEHTTQLESLLKVYPDAMLVQNHRDPSKVMASLASIMSGLQKLSTDQAPEISRPFMLGLMQALASGQERLIQLRQNPEIDKHFIDVSYLDLERNPLAVMQRIYERTDMPFNQAAKDGISHWVETHRKGKHGKHGYSLKSVSVTQAEVHAMFRNYLERFEIELEPEA